MSCFSSLDIDEKNTEQLSFQQQLISMSACIEAVEWVGDMEFIQAWKNTCERADWLRWYTMKFAFKNKEIWVANNQYCDFISRTQPGPLSPKDMADIFRRYVTPDMFSMCSIL